MTAQPSSITETFLEYFDVCLATDKAMRDETGRIRYRVYCEEFGYESKDAFPDGIETDEFDDDSIHCLVTHKSSNTPAGCVRVVRARPEGLLPLEKYCAQSLDSDFLNLQNTPREIMCEVSRLAVDPMFRRRSGEKSTRFGGMSIATLSAQEQRSFPLIAVSCFLAGNIMADLSGRTNMFAMMEPFLPKLLRRSGIDFAKIGRDIDYHGLRAPYFITSTELKANLAPTLTELYAAIQSVIEKDYSATT